MKNQFINYLVELMTNQIDGIQAILLAGSYRDENQVDFWSDFDMVVVLNQKTRLDKDLFIQTINSLGNRIGSESYIKPNSILYRTVIEYRNSLKILDVSICTYSEWLENDSTTNNFSLIYGELELTSEGSQSYSNFSFESFTESIDGTWFKFIQSIKKIARNDNLIGLHLALDLIKDYLVVEMIERDIKHHTNIHRFGYSERLPENLKLSLLVETDRESILNYLDSLAFEYDKKLMININNYKSRYDAVSKYINETKQNIQLHK